MIKQGIYIYQEGSLLEELAVDSLTDGIIKDSDYNHDFRLGQDSFAFSTPDDLTKMLAIKSLDNMFNSILKVRSEKYHGFPSESVYSDEQLFAVAYKKNEISAVIRGVYFCYEKEQKQNLLGKFFPKPKDYAQITGLFLTFHGGDLTKEPNSWFIDVAETWKRMCDKNMFPYAYPTMTSQ